ncbi:16559_t:CDS:2, partial [Funneliformis geosporum]
IKVRKPLSADAWQEGILISIILCEQMETGKYPEAYIFPLHAKSLNESGLKEELEKKISLTEAKSEVIIDALKSEYFSVFFNDAYLDAQQLALKVYMNSFYSEAGN